MKKVWILFVFLGLCVLLSACKPDEQTQALLNKGNAYMEKQDYEKAAVAYGDAYNADNSSKIFKQLTEARKKQVEVLRNEYNEVYQNADYKKAESMNKRIQKDFSDLLSKEDLATLKKDAKEIKDYLEAQNLYDNYLLWAKPYILKIKSDYGKFQGIKTSLTIGGYAYTQIDKSLADLVVEASKSEAAIDAQLENVPPSLSKIHRKLLTVSQQFHTSYSTVLGAVRQATNPQEIIDSTDSAQEAIDGLNTVISQFQAYAADKGIKDTYSNVIVENGKAKFVK
ncbi:hypothetical protein CN918_25985 [Priestia megaterium]|nr:hypothetical protein CN918_25985 [Priestia megaterium]